MNALQTSVEREDRPVTPPPSGRKRRRRFETAPYVLIAPTIVVLAGVLGYPMIRLVVLSFQQWGGAQIFQSVSGKWIGFSNYSTVLTSGFFWKTVERSIILTVVMVGASMLIGTLVSLLMRRVSTWVRYFMTFGLVLAWSVPTAESSLVFNWMTDFNYGVVNWMFGLGHHNWYVDNVQGFAVATAVVVWGAVPMIAIMVYAALTQVPQELVEAARVDGASPGQVFGRIVVPIIKPVLVIMTTLSVIWDFQVFNQIYVLRNGNPTQDDWTLGIYSYQTGLLDHSYGLASAMAVITVILLLVVMVFYLRQILRAGEAE